MRTDGFLLPGCAHSPHSRSTVVHAWKVLAADASWSCGADGNAAVTGAYAALAEYYSNKQTRQNDCGLNLGWSHPGARPTKKSVNNIRACASSYRCPDCLGLFLLVLLCLATPAGPALRAAVTPVLWLCTSVQVCRITCHEHVSRQYLTDVPLCCRPQDWLVRQQSLSLAASGLMQCYDE